MDSKKALKNIKNIASIVFIIILVFQVFAFGYITKTNSYIDTTIQILSELENDFSQTFVNDTIRQNQRLDLNSIRQSWIQYVNIHNSEILKKDDNNNYIFQNASGTRITFNPDTMDKIKNKENLYDIIDKQTNDILLTNCRPIWNKKTISKILNIIGYSNETFGEKDDLIIYDLYNGEVLMDNNSDNTLCKEILDENGKRNLTLYYMNPHNKNPEQYKDLTKQLLNRFDTQNLTKLTSLFNESTLKATDDYNNFKLYPFGEYNRDFIEKIVLPYENVDMEGLDMLLGVTISANEKELYSAYIDSFYKYEKILTELKYNKKIIQIIPTLCMALSLLIIVVSLCCIRLSAYYSRKN